MNTVKINGITIECSSGNISINGNKIIVDGKEINNIKEREVTIVGDVNNLDVTGSVDVKGNIGNNVQVGGSLKSGNIGGDAMVGGSLVAFNIDGSISAGGSVHIRK